MKSCSACGGAARKLRRALILAGPNSLRRGQVCGACERLGWLLVMGPDAVDAPVVNAGDGRRRLRSDAKTAVAGDERRRRRNGARTEPHEPAPLPQPSREQLLWSPGLAAQLEQLRGTAKLEQLRPPSAAAAAPPAAKDLDTKHARARASTRIEGEWSAMEEDLYQKFKQRLMREAPALLKLLATSTELEVKVERRVVELDSTSLRGRLAQMIAEDFFETPKTGNTAWVELKRVGFRCAKPGVYRQLDELTALGILTKEGSEGYLVAPGAKVRLK